MLKNIKNRLDNVSYAYTNAQSTTSLFHVYAWYVMSTVMCHNYVYLPSHSVVACECFIPSVLQPRVLFQHCISGP